MLVLALACIEAQRAATTTAKKYNLKWFWSNVYSSKTPVVSPIIISATIRPSCLTHPGLSVSFSFLSDEQTDSLTVVFLFSCLLHSTTFHSVSHHNHSGTIRLKPACSIFQSVIRFIRLGSDFGKPWHAAVAEETKTQECDLVWQSLFIFPFLWKGQRASEGSSDTCLASVDSDGDGKLIIYGCWC